MTGIAYFQPKSGGAGGLATDPASAPFLAASSAPKKMPDATPKRGIWHLFSDHPPYCGNPTQKTDT